MITIRLLPCERDPPIVRLYNLSTVGERQVQEAVIKGGQRETHPTSYTETTYWFLGVREHGGRIPESEAAQLLLESGNMESRFSSLVAVLYDADTGGLSVEDPKLEARFSSLFAVLRSQVRSGFKGFRDEGGLRHIHGQADD